jgi:hypothetical protein
MRSYFIRHTEKMSVRDEDLQDLWNQNRIAIHYPDRLDGDRSVDNDSTEPDDYPDYPSKGRAAMRVLKELAENGGYVWVESCVDRKRAKVGRVHPRGIEVCHAKWAYNSDYPGREAALKTVQFECVNTVEMGEAVGLRAGRPRQGTIVRWHCGTRLADLVEGNTTLQEWGNLSTEQQEAACAEFLRHHEGDHPRVRFLLLPVGRTLKDVDIYGLDPDGHKVFAQVTYHKPGSKEFGEKLEKLKEYANSDTGVKLVYFCRCADVAEDDGVYYIPVSNEKSGVLGWIKANPLYSNTLFTY